MEDDGEKEKVKFIEDLKKQGEQILVFQKGIRSLKTRISKLTGRVEQIENLEFQNQISSLSDKVESLNKSFLNAKRIVAVNGMNFNQYHICENIMNQYEGEEEANLKGQIRIMYARASEAVKTSKKPLTLMLKFTQECAKFSKEHNLDAFV